MAPSTLAFIGGGHMASAVLGGLIKAGHATDRLLVVEPAEPAARSLRERFGIQPMAAAGPALARADVVVWAVKPQVFAQAAAPCAAHVGQALQLSVMAGVRCDAIARATGATRIVRAMPNTPALIGCGMAGLFATPEVGPAERQAVEQLLAPTGQTLWLGREDQLDAVTALSGSGPAYVFYLIEAMVRAAATMGLDPVQARTLAQGTVAGAAALVAARADVTPAELRAQVTSKGGTTHAAMSVLEAAGAGAAIEQAILAAERRARELGDELAGDRGAAAQS